jgi:hypothetical protein
MLRRTTKPYTLSHHWQHTALQAIAPCISGKPDCAPEKLRFLPDFFFDSAGLPAATLP